MRTRSALELASLVGAELVGDPTAMVGPGVVIDARQADPGALFVAIPGERVDGHDFTGQAHQAGAAAVLGTRATDAPLVHLVADDSVAALSRLAHGLVEEARGTGLVTLAITGSSGKTSTKDLLAQVLESAGSTVSPVGSFNNEIGVPLTACGVDEHTRFLVSEMGARGIGHISWLCSLVRPDIALALNVGTAHLGEFGSRETIAQAKGEIVEALPASGWAVLNADDELVAGMATRTGAHLAWWSRTSRWDQGAARPDGELFVHAVQTTSNALEQYSFTLVVERDGSRSEPPVELLLLGSHQVSKPRAAATAAIAAGLDPARVARALTAATTRSHWRMEMLRRADGAAVLNDSYNANPDSMFEAISTIGRIGAARKAQDASSRTYAVLGDMLELGEGSDQLHRDLGALAIEHGVDEVIAVGTQAQLIAEGAHSVGGSARVSARDEVAGSLTLGPADVVLVKASRGIGLEVVADQLVGAQVESGHEGKLR